MGTLAAAELRKIATLRSSWALAAAGLVLSAAVGWAGVWLAADPRTLTWPRLAGAAAPPAWFLASLIGTLAAAGEFQHRTIRTAVLITPRRSRLLLAKLLAVSTCGAALAIACALVAVGSGGITAASGNTPVHDGGLRAWWALLGVPFAAAAVAVIGAAVGMLARGTAVAVGALLTWRFLGEGVAPVLIRRPGAAAWLPSGASNRLIHAPDLHAALGSLGALTAYATVLAAMALTVFTRRDIA